MVICVMTEGIKACRDNMQATKVPLLLNSGATSLSSPIATLPPYSREVELQGALNMKDNHPLYSILLLSISHLTARSYYHVWHSKCGLCNRYIIILFVSELVKSYSYIFKEIIMACLGSRPHDCISRLLFLSVSDYNAQENTLGYSYLF